MRILIPAAGTRGDVQPAIALSPGLQQAGHAVRVVAFEEYRELVTGYGLECLLLRSDLQGLAQRYGKPELFDSGVIIISFLPELIRMFRLMYTQLTCDIWQAALDPGGTRWADVLIGNPSTLMLSAAVAEKLGAVHAETSVFPGWPTRAFPTIFWPRASSPGDGGGLRGTFNRLTYEPVNWAAKLWLGPIVSRCRKEILGLPSTALLGRSSHPGEQRTPALAGFSEHVLPRPTDWDAHIHITGYWFLDTPSYQPPAELVNFLESSPPPVYIGFGSMPSKDPQQTAELMAQALRLAGARGLLYTSSGVLGRGMAHIGAGEDILAIDSTPHEWLFPRCAAVVHHGGAGATAAGLRAGVPSILVPIVADQLLWAQRVDELGVGPQPIPRARLTPQRLAEAIGQALTDQAMRQRATLLGEKIRAEDGVANAVRFIHQYLVV